MYLSFNGGLSFILLCSGAFHQLAKLTTETFRPRNKNKLTKPTVSPLFKNVPTVTF